MIQITSDNIEISPSMQKLAQEKLASIERRLSEFTEDLKDIRVVLNSAPLEQFTAKIEVSLGSHQYFADETKYSIETAIIEAVENIERQLEKAKDIQEKDWEKQREAKRFPEDIA